MTIFPVLHESAILTGGSVPAHVPGAYPSLSCCGGSVQLVPATTTPRFPTITEDVTLTDWYAGAWAEANFPVPGGGELPLDWTSCHARLAFSNIGRNEADNRLHGQVVAYTLGFDGRQRAVSTEIDPDDAERIIEALAAFVAAAKRDADLVADERPCDDVEA